jgi:molybdopterin synthase catalytic subunit
MSVHVHIIDGPVPADAGIELSAGAGAAVTFDGVVRPREGDRAIDALHYTAYEPMATSELTRLAGEMVHKHGLLTLAIWHSRGRVGAGEVSMRVVIHSRHRAEALAAMGEFIDRLKRDVPIWKSV